MAAIIVNLECNCTCAYCDLYMCQVWFKMVLLSLRRKPNNCIIVKFGGKNRTTLKYYDHEGLPNLLNILITYNLHSPCYFYPKTQNPSKLDDFKTFTGESVDMAIVTFEYFQNITRNVIITPKTNGENLVWPHHLGIFFKFN